MKGKLAILGLVVILGGYLVVSNSSTLFPNSSDVPEIIKQDLTDFAKDTSEKLDDAKDNSLSVIGDKIENLKKSSTNLLSNQNKKDDIIPTSLDGDGFYGKINSGDTTVSQQPQNTGTNGASSGSNGASSGSNGASSGSNGASSGSNGASSGSSGGGTTSTTILIPPQTTNPLIVQPPIDNENPFDTLSLIIKKQSNNNIMMKYVDTSGKTNSVTITMRNEDRVLFTGQFFSSSFENITLDTIETSHFIDLVIDHSKHGQITATAFSPVGNTDTTFYGVFTKN